MVNISELVAFYAVEDFVESVLNDQKENWRKWRRRRRLRRWGRHKSQWPSINRCSTVNSTHSASQERVFRSLRCASIFYVKYLLDCMQQRIEFQFYDNFISYCFTIRLAFAIRVQGVHFGAN